MPSSLRSPRHGRNGLPKAEDPSSALVALAPLPEFSRLLPHPPLPLAGAFRGDAGRLAVVYDEAACQNLSRSRKAWIGPLERKIEELKLRAQTKMAEYGQWEHRLLTTETPPDYVALLEWTRARVGTGAGDDPAPDAEPVLRAVYADLQSALAPPLRTEEDLDAFAAATAALTAELAAITEEVQALQRALALRLIEALVLEIGVPVDSRDSKGRVITTLTWPYRTARPTPGEPETWAVFDGLVLDWLTTVGPEQVRTEMRSPNSSRR